MVSVAGAIVTRATGQTALAGRWTARSARSPTSRPPPRTCRT